jgi:D-galactarolactone cycloisomerase
MLGRQLEEFNLEFWEEPINKWDVEGYRRLKNALRIPLASGERLPVDWLIENYINRKTVDIAQPDIMDCGFTGGKRITNACTVNRVRLVPHSAGSPIRIVAEIHWVACVPPLSRAWNPPPQMFELHVPGERPGWSITRKPVVVDPSDGLIEAPTGPGMGIEINRDELERHRTELIAI